MTNPEGTPLDEKGVLTALVWRMDDDPHGDVLALEIQGEAPEIEPWIEAGPGGDWCEVNIIHEDSPSPPPTGYGLWQMRWPWHRLTAEERAEHGDELCCMYEGKPEWTHLSALPASPAPATAGEGPSERFERVAEAFCDATGMLAPGKDDASGSHSYEDRMEAWRIFTAGRKSASDIPLAAPPLPAVPPLSFEAQDELRDRADRAYRYLQTHSVEPREDRCVGNADACTGVAARWCPRCGTCTCPEQEMPICGSGGSWSADAACPLHGPHSRHAAPRADLAAIRKSLASLRASLNPLDHGLLADVSQRVEAALAAPVPAEVEAAIEDHRKATLWVGFANTTDMTDAVKCLATARAHLLALYRAVPATGGEPVAKGTVYGWAAGQMSIVGDPAVPVGEIQIRDDAGHVLVRMVGFDTAPVPPASVDRRCDEKYPFGNCDCPPAPRSVGNSDALDAARWRAFSRAEGTAMCSVGPYHGYYLSGAIVEDFNQSRMPSHNEYADALIRATLPPSAPAQETPR